MKVKLSLTSEHCLICCSSWNYTRQNTESNCPWPQSTVWSVVLPEIYKTEYRVKLSLTSEHCLSTILPEIYNIEYTVKVKLSLTSEHCLICCSPWNIQDRIQSQTVPDLRALSDLLFSLKYTRQNTESNCPWPQSTVYLLFSLKYTT